MKPEIDISTGGYKEFDSKELAMEFAQERVVRYWITHVSIPQFGIWRVSWWAQ